MSPKVFERKWHEMCFAHLNVMSGTLNWLNMFLVPPKCEHWFYSFRPTGPCGQEVLLVTVPDFSSTQTACLVNLRTFGCEPVKFSAFSAADDDEESEMNISHWPSLNQEATQTFLLLIKSLSDFEDFDRKGQVNQHTFTKLVKEEQTNIMYKQAFICKITLPAHSSVSLTNCEF